MSILPYNPHRFTKVPAYPRAQFRRVETLLGVRTLTIEQDGIVIFLSGVHAEEWIREHREQLAQSFDD